jgi:hypothetical protein
MKTTFFNILMLFASVQLFAQPNHEAAEKIRSKKIAYLTEYLKLTPEEAQKFWPVYNQKEDESKELRKQMHEINKNKKWEDMTDAEAENMLEQMLIIRQKELDLDKKYLQKFKEVIPVKKVAMLHKAEIEFRKEMIKEMRHNRQERHPNKPHNK